VNLADQMALDAGQPAAGTAQPPAGNLSASMVQDAAPSTLSATMAADATPATAEPAKPTGWTMGEPGLGVTTGLAEGALALGTGGAAALAAGGMGWLERAGGKSWEEIQADQKALQQRLQYQPQTTIGKGIAEAGGWVGGKLDELGAWAAEHAGNLAEAAGASPETVAAIKTGTHAATMALAPKAAAGAVGGAVGAVKAISGAAGDVAAGMGRGAPAPLFEPQAAGAVPGGASVGAAASASGRMSVASPELAAGIATEIADAQARYGPAWKEHFNADALDRKLEADSLPVRGFLTEGQAAQDPVIVSEELNNRGTVTDMAKVMQAQNKIMQDNLQAVREQTAPDVNTINATEHGQALIDAYNRFHAPRQAAIDADWDVIRANTGGAPIFDAGRMLQDSQAALKAKLLSSQDPGGQLAELTDAARRGGLTADGYNAFRQNLGAIARQGGTEGKAASIVIDATNKSDLLPEAAKFRGMVNDALAKGRALHADLEADPAYNAAINGTVSANDFVNKFLTGGSAKVENIAQMLKNLGNDDLASQTMRAAVVDNLRDSARLDNQYQGDFASKSFNKQLATIGQRSGQIFQGGELSTLQTLGNYARNVKEAPAGNFINRSNSAVAAPGIFERAAGMAGGAVESLVNRVPVAGPLITGGIRARAAAAAAAQQELDNAQFLHRAIRPGAGVIRR
jgi:hypothetical protein